MTASDFAAWLGAAREEWEPSANEEGLLVFRDDPKRPVALVGSPCSGLQMAHGRAIRVASGTERRPVTCISWFGADRYCRAQTKRLPTDAEWELAAKGSAERIFPWGSDPPQHDAVAFDLAADGHPRDVGTSRMDVTPEGIHDLAANVAEWVQGSFATATPSRRPPGRRSEAKCRFPPRRGLRRRRWPRASPAN